MSNTRYPGIDLCRGKFACFHILPTSAVQRHRSNQTRPLLRSGKGLIFLNLCLQKAEVCNQNAEVDEGAEEGAGGVSTRVFHRF